MNRVIENAIKNLEIQVEYAMYKPQREALLDILTSLRGVSNERTPDYDRHGETFQLEWLTRNAGNESHFTTHTYDAYNERGYTFAGYRLALIAEGKNGGGVYKGKTRKYVGKDGRTVREHPIGKSGYRGVTCMGKRFMAKRKLNGETKYLGMFDCPIAAHNAYLAAK